MPFERTTTDYELFHAIQKARAYFAEFGFSPGFGGLGTHGPHCFIGVRHIIDIDVALWNEARVLIRAAIYRRTGDPLYHQWPGEKHTGYEFSDQYLERHNIDTQAALEVLDDVLARVV